MLSWIFVVALFAAAAAKPQSYIIAPGHFHYEFGGQNEYKFASPTPAPVKTVSVSTPSPVVSTVVTPVVKKVEYQVNPISTYKTGVSPVSVSTVRPVTAQQITVSQVPAQQDHFQVNPITTYKTAVSPVSVSTVRPVTAQQITVSQVPAQQDHFQVNPITTYKTAVSPVSVSTVRPVNTQQITVSQVPAQHYISQYPVSQVGQYGSQFESQYGTGRITNQQVRVNVQPQITKTVTTSSVQPVSGVRSGTVSPVVTVQSRPQNIVQQYQAGQNYGGYAILRYVFDVLPQGSYNYAYETENGIKAEEAGQLKNVGTQDEAEVAEGYYSYTGPDGVVYTVRYIADENGFRAEGDHLPKVPEAIQRALEYLRTLPPQPDEQKK